MSKFKVDLCGVKESIQFNLNELDTFDVIQYIKTQNIKQNRLFIGVAGGPGSGKTLFGKILSLYITEKLNIKSVCISSDGYHYDNKTLIKMNIRNQKGLPQSMNDKKLYNDMLKLKDQTMESVYLPVYDREIHNPVENAIEVKKDIEIIIFEGLYMIYWENVKGLLDYIVFMEANKQNMRNRLKDRKIRMGGTLQDVRKNFENVDSKSMKITAIGRRVANSVIKSDIIKQQLTQNNHSLIKYKQMLPSKL
eukprot:167359_1